MPIRKKILIGSCMLAGTVLLLTTCSLRGVYAYRDLASMISLRATELPLSDKLAQEVDSLRVSYQPNRFWSNRDPFGENRDRQLQEKFQMQLSLVKKCLSDYKTQLQLQSDDNSLLADRSAEWKLVREIQIQLSKIEQATDNQPFYGNGRAPYVEEDLYELSQKVHELPTHLHRQMAEFRDQVRNRYRTWYGFIYLTTGASLLIIGVAFIFFRRSVVQPFKELLTGTRIIARGNFEHRITLNSHDELAELADTLNAMTSRFVSIRDNLNEKVKLRTQEVVRSEQLASVGFLAAGVAHEINNPLASIAWSAEALESRLHEALHGRNEGSETSDTPTNPPFSEAELQVLRKYLKRIQDEAFRCKGITERLLDFSRLGESQKRQHADVNELVGDVIGLVEHLPPYRSKKIEFLAQPGLTAWVSPTEFKQVVLNLLTNALDSTDDSGIVTLQLQRTAENMCLLVQDNGCGMTEEVQKHLFEPFFTRRRDGKGTGLGLSITYRIVQDHGGQLIGTSQGPGLGSQFELTLPLAPENGILNENQQYAA